MNIWRTRFPWLGLGFAALVAMAVGGADAQAQVSNVEQKPQAESKPDASKPPAPGLIRLSPDYDVWIDQKRKIVVVDGKVCLRAGQLEMFACPKNTKEHESIVSVNSSARFVHAGLLAVGGRVGHPVRFDPKYVPASGTEVEVLVLWKDQDGKKRKVRAQEWIKHVESGKKMKYPWVFAGSGFWVEESTKTRHYHGDAGDFICVSNFPTATLDLPVKSSQDGGSLLFTAFTERIPPLGTKVRLVLAPKLKK